MTAHFTPELFGFLADLETNNNRDWFQQNKPRYLEDVQEPALEFITEFGPRLRAISPHFRADAKAQGGSLFRIYRDTRFGKDKTPYKTNTGMQFRHERAKDAHAPGFYLHLEPGGSFMGVGLWRPTTAVAYAIREYIDENSDDWESAAHSAEFAESFSLQGDSLKRPPRGYDADHPLIEDLRRKDFIASHELSDADVVAEDFIDTMTDLCRGGSPFMAFLCRAVGVEY